MAPRGARRGATEDEKTVAVLLPRVHYGRELHTAEYNVGSGWMLLVSFRRAMSPAAMPRSVRRSFVALRRRPDALT